MEYNNENMENRVGNAAEGQQAAARIYTTAEKLLIAAALLLGVIFSWVVFGKNLESSTLGQAGLRYSAFWLVYLIAFYAATWRRSKSKPFGWALAALALWLMARYAVYAERSLNTLNFIAIPLVMMLHAVECTAEVPSTRQGGYIRAYFAGWFVSPFVRITCFFGAMGSLFKAKPNDARSRAVRLGIIAGAALALVVVPLLFASDAAMQKIADGMFDGVNIGPAAIRTVFALIVAMLFYSFIYRTAFEPGEYSKAPYRRAMPGAGVCAALGVLIAIYAAFAVFQFTYLTGLAGLPDGLTYSEYAVHGFAELCAVAAINLAVFAVCVTFAEDTKAVRALLAALLVMTALLIASAAVRLFMYTEAYGLTVKRILSFWFMACLALVCALCAAKIFRPGLRLLRAAAGVFCVMYLALSLLNLDGMIAESVLVKAEAAGNISVEDADYLRYTLSADAKPAIGRSPLAPKVYYDVDPADLKK